MGLIKSKNQSYDGKKKMRHLNKFLSSKTAVIILFSLITVVIGSHQLLIGKKAPNEEDHVYTYYNNYVIFKESFHHLLDHQNPYALYPQEHADYFKYSPAFAMFFGFFALLPDYIGLNLWNLLNTMVLLLAVYFLPGSDNRKKGLILLLCLAELVTSLQNSQSNALVAGLMIFSFASLERNNGMAASLFMTLSVFIKLFGIVGFALFLMYPKFWKNIIYTVCWALLFGLLPLLVVNFSQLSALYSQWWQLLRTDHSASYGLSVAGILHAWFGAETGKTAVTAAGAALFMLPFARPARLREYTGRILMLSSLLIWVVIFNHKAESPTFIIAFAGISIWYFSAARTVPDTVLFIFAFIVTCLSPTDLVPRPLRISFFEPYMLKALPSVLVWIRILAELMLPAKRTGTRKNEEPTVA